MTKLSMSWMTILLLAMASVQHIQCQISLVITSDNMDETETITSQVEMTTSSLDYSDYTVSSSLAAIASSVHSTSAAIFIQGTSSTADAVWITATKISATATQAVQPSSSASGGTTAPTTQPATSTPAWGQWTAWVYEACSVPCGNGTRIGFRKRCHVSSSSGGAAGTPFCDTVQSLPVACFGTSCPTLPGTATNDSRQGHLYSIPLIVVLALLSVLQYYL